MSPDLIPWYIFMVLLSFTWGACIGSFLNVCIYRIPRELSVIKPRSFCPHCKKQIAWYHNIPVLSFLLLGGKCRYCGARISPRYFFVELVVGILFVLVWIKYHPLMVPRPLGLTVITHLGLIPIYWLVISGLTLGTCVDIEHLIIPDRVTLGGIAVGILCSVAVPELHGQSTRLLALLWSLAGAAVGWTVLWFISVIGRLIFHKDAMGFGDVKLLAAVGAFFGITSVFFTLLVSSLVGSIAGIGLVIVHKRKMQSRIPYGPFIALAAVIWMLWGPSLWGFYLRLISLPLPIEY